MPCYLIVTSAIASEQAIAVAQPDESLTLTPGSQSLFNFTNDPTVTCLHNPYQPKCRQGHIDWPREQQYYSKAWIYSMIFAEPGSNRLSCVDFYNKTAATPLRWQALRQKVHLEMRETNRTIILKVKGSACNMDINIDTNNSSAIDFYIYCKPDTVKECKIWHPDWYRQGDENSNRLVVDICYVDHGFNSFQLDNDYITFVFNFLAIDCLQHYGEIAENHTNAKADAANGT